MASDRKKRNTLDALLDDMHDWTRARDPEVVRRRSDAIDVDSKLFIVGEAYAKDQVRKAGVNWIRRDGSIGPAGKNLEGLLNRVGYTVRPPMRTGPRGSAPSEPNYRTVYTTDLVPYYPLPNGKLRRAQVEEALATGFLKREIALLGPRALLVLGSHSYGAVWPWLLQARTCRTFADEVAQTDAGAIQHLSVDGLSIAVFVLRHPSPRNPKNHAWYGAVGKGGQASPVFDALRQAVSRWGPGGLAWQPCFHLRRAVLRHGEGLGDGELLGGCIERHDEAALAALVKRRGPVVWGVCRRLLTHQLPQFHDGAAVAGDNRLEPALQVEPARIKGIGVISAYFAKKRPTRLGCRET